MQGLNEIRQNIVIPALVEINAYSTAAEQLVMMTGMAESLFKHTRQIVKYTPIKYGPARGWFQMEPATHNDIWSNYFGGSRTKHLVEGLQRLNTNAGDPEELVKDQKYAAAMCRIHYLRVRERLPDEGHWHGMATYWKKYYNTHLGKGTVDGFLQKNMPVMQLYEAINGRAGR